MTTHGARHFSHFLGPFVDEQHDQYDVRVVRGNGMCQLLHQHGFTGLRRRHDQAALALADGGDDVDDARGHVFLALDVAFELELLVRMQRGQVLEQDLVLGRFGCIRIDLVHLDQREVALAILGGADLAFDRVTGMQVEAPDLRRGNVDVVGGGEVGRVR